LTVAVDKIGGTGTYADWNLSLAGDPGVPGVAGSASMVGTSTTSLSITSAAVRTFTVAAGLGFGVGTRLRAVSDADPTNDYMEGVVTDYTGTALEVSMDRSQGSGTHADWTITIAGDPGLVAGTVVSYDFGIFFGGTPTSSQLMAMFVAGRAFTLPDDFAGAVGRIGVNPTSSFVIDVEVNGSAVGTITIGTGGAFTFNTTGGAVSISVGDYVEIIAPSVVDGTAEDISISFLGTRVI
jgi:hypothetical protein